MRLTSLTVALLYTDGRTAVVTPGCVVQVEAPGGVRSRLVVTYIDSAEPMLMGMWNGTNLTGGCRSTQVVSVERR